MAVPNQDNWKYQKFIIERANVADLQTEINDVVHLHDILQGIDVMGDSAGVISYLAVYIRVTHSDINGYVAPPPAWSYDDKVIEANTASAFETACNDKKLVNYNIRFFRFYLDSLDVKHFVAVLSKFIIP